MRQATWLFLIWTIAMGVLVLLLPDAEPDAAGWAWVAETRNIIYFFGILVLWLIGLGVFIRVRATDRRSSGASQRNGPAWGVGVGMICGRCREPLGWGWTRCERCEASYAEFPPTPEDAPSD